jgi:alpha/beta superfamily hydrolase
MGYSFGAGVAYRAAVRDGNVERLCLIAPTLRMRDQIGDYGGPVQIVAAQNDEFATTEETAELARRLGAPVHVIEGADHFFVRYRREVASIALRFLAPELPT